MNNERLNHKLKKKVENNTCRSLFPEKKGFTLVELMVSLSITSILLLGMSVFFSSTFANLFRVQKQTDTVQRQFAVNEIIRTKFANLEKIISIDKDQPDYVVIKNKTDKKQLPISYISQNAERNLVFKDLLLFNKIIFNNDEYLMGASGSGNLRAVKKSDNNISAPTENPLLTATFHNMGGFVLAGEKYFITMPIENKVLQCDCGGGSCSKDSCDEISINGLNAPTDISINNAENHLYITNSGNGQILDHELNKGTKVVVSQLNYPTGVVYYRHGDDEYLFVAETLNNQIKRIKLHEDPTQIEIKTVVGEGSDMDCNNTAKYCQLNLPTGLYYDPDTDSLFIGDSGNDRVIQMSNAPKPSEIIFNIEMEDHYALDKIEIENANWTNGGTYNPAKVSNSTKKLVGNVGNFSNKTFISSTVLSIYDGTATDNCKTSNNSFFVNDDVNTLGIQLGTWLSMNGDIFQVNIAPGQPTKCNNDPQDTVQKWRLQVTGNDVSGFTSGKVYIANPTSIELPIDGINLSSNNSGFQRFTINIYDKTNGLVETSYYTERVGDDLLGNNDDIVQVVSNSNTNPGINFPTGVSNRFFVSSGEGKIRAIDAIQEPALSGVDINTFSTDELNIFDYTSNFTVKENGLIFSEDKNNNILQLNIEAEIDSEKTQNYSINAIIP